MDSSPAVRFSIVLELVVSLSSLLLVLVVLLRVWDIIISYNYQVGMKVS